MRKVLIALIFVSCSLVTQAQSIFKFNTVTINQSNDSHYVNAKISIMGDDDFVVIEQNDDRTAWKIRSVEKTKMGSNYTAQDLETGMRITVEFIRTTEGMMSEVVALDSYGQPFKTYFYSNKLY